MSYLQSNPVNDYGVQFQDFLEDVTLEDYLQAMARNGTYGDELTLRAATEMFNVEFVVISTLGAAGQRTITPRNFASQGRVYLGHFVEGRGDYYIVLETIEDESDLPNNGEEDENIDENNAKR